jgi:tRNA (cytidine/uridine-2'-O-)-methyltransferase
MIGISDDRSVPPTYRNFIYLAAQPLFAPFMPHIVLVHPQIPPNTGNIARTCAATKTHLHLVKPLGFEITDRYLKRAGLDYWPYVSLHIHESIEELLALKQQGRWLGFSTKGTVGFQDFSYEPEDWLLFGSETDGLTAIALENCDSLLTIPMGEPRVRSLNLSVSVAMAISEVYRQIGWS